MLSTQPDTSPKRATRVVVVLMAIAIPAAVGLWLKGAPAAPVEQRVAVAVAPAAKAQPHILGVALDKAHVTHTELMAEGHKLKVSSILPPPKAHSAGRDAKDAERRPTQDALAGVPNGRKIALFFTGNVVGETDPCG